MLGVSKTGDCESQQAYAETIHLWTDRTAMTSTYNPHMHRQHIRTPLITQQPSRLHTYNSFRCLNVGDLLCNAAVSLMVALDTQWNTRVLSKVLMCNRMKEAELSSRDVSLSLCSSTSSYLHIVDCTHLTGWLFPKPQCPLASTLYKHPTNLEYNSHYLPAHIHIHFYILPFPLLGLRVCLQWPIL